MNPDGRRIYSSFCLYPGKAWHNNQEIYLRPVKKLELEVDLLLGGKENRYRIIHMGSSTRLKEWPEHKWKSLAKKLVQEGNILVFTGQGEREELSVGRTTSGLDHCINACGRLSWDGLVELIRRAELLYAVETSVGHVAAAVGTPTVSIKDWRYSVSRWKPFGDQSVAVHTDLPCFPCCISRGCESMACVREIPVEAVYQAGKQAMKQKSTHGSGPSNLRPGPLRELCNKQREADPYEGEEGGGLGACRGRGTAELWAIYMILPGSY